MHSLPRSVRGLGYLWGDGREVSAMGKPSKSALSKGRADVIVPVFVEGLEVRRLAAPWVRADVDLGAAQHPRHASQLQRL